MRWSNGRQTTSVRIIPCRLLGTMAVPLPAPKGMSATFGVERPESIEANIGADIALLIVAMDATGVVRVMIRVRKTVQGNRFAKARSRPHRPPQGRNITAD